MFDKPLVTYLLFSYNQEEYIEESVLSALDQTYEPLEIIISDDFSNDRTYKIIRNIVSKYKGSHQVIINRNNNNLGIIKHLNSITPMIRGELIVGAAGDDISEKNRVEKIVKEYINSSKKIQYFCSCAKTIDANGCEGDIIFSPGAKNIHSKYLAGLSPHPIGIGATQAWTSKLSLHFTPLRSAIFGEDQILGFRGILLGGALQINEPLIKYRVGSGVSTQKNNFQLIRYYKNKTNTIQMYWQRVLDSRKCKQKILAAVIFTKIFLLVSTLPMSPIISLIYKSKEILLFISFILKNKS